MRDSAAAAAGVAAGMAIASSRDAMAAKVAPGTEPWKKTRSYNENMEYRRLGKTGLWVSAVCMGGHWKRIDKMVPGVFKGRGWLSADLDSEGFQKNRYDVVSRCIESGINHIDACTIQEVKAYSRALKGRREKMFLGCSWYQKEMRNAGCRTAKALLETLDWGMKDAGLEYADLWRITMHEKSGRHTEGEVQEMMKALETAKKQGKVRLTGFSSHDRKHIKWMIETFPQVVDVIVTPYTSGSKVLPADSLFDALKKYDVGMFGIKPFGGNSLFKGDASLDGPNAESDDRLARLAIRYILCNPAVTAPIPGIINAHQVDNLAKAVKERRELDGAEKAELQKATDEMWANLPEDYQWLKDWEYV
ncbi:MAG: aldo/keto reductase, partial [Phycisphaerae bacterium]